MTKNIGLAYFLFQENALPSNNHDNSIFCELPN